MYDLKNTVSAVIRCTYLGMPINVFIDVGIIIVTYSMLIYYTKRFRTNGFPYRHACPFPHFRRSLKSGQNKYRAFHEGMTKISNTQ